MTTWVEVQNYLVWAHINRLELTDPDEYLSELSTRALNGEAHQADMDSILQRENGFYRTVVGLLGIHEGTDILITRDDDWLHLLAPVGDLAQVDLRGFVTEMGAVGIGGLAAIDDQLYIRSSVQLPSLQQPNDVLDHMVALMYAIERFTPERMAERRQRLIDEVETARVDDFLASLRPHDE